MTTPTPTLPEARRLADELDAEAGRITQYTNRPGDLLRELAADELRRLHSEVTTLQAELAAMRAGGEVACKQYQSRDGEWRNFIGPKHEADTSAGGKWPIRSLYTHPKPAAQDAELLDWLGNQYVTVRIPLPYGSRECFIGSPDDNDGAAPSPWDIRAAIRTAIAAQQGGA